MLDGRRRPGGMLRKRQQGSAHGRQSRDSAAPGRRNCLGDCDMNIRRASYVRRAAFRCCSAIALAAGLASAAAAEDQPGQPADQSATSTAPDAATQQSTAAGDNEIVVTGYRASLQSATNAKRESVGFTDSIFAEDIGKFPDTNIAESLNRVPGVIISREVTGEGLQVAIRGLGTSFTRVLLNNAPVAIASTGRTDAQSTNREVDLDLLPTELFTRLTVSKSPTAEMLEGGAAG